MCAYFTNVSTKTFDAVTADRKPKFQCAKSTAQGNTPVLNERSQTGVKRAERRSYSIIDRLLSVLMLQVEWVDGHGVNQCELISNPSDRGDIERASTDVSVSYQKHEQSKFINSHLFGLVLNESAY